MNSKELAVKLKALGQMLNFYDIEVIGLNFDLINDKISVFLWKIEDLDKIDGKVIEDYHCYENNQLYKMFDGIKFFALKKVTRSI